ncbi:hypothetical protein E0765_07155 [Sulfuricurvum sp. IAE1]|uniref:hypothetical protein n=1 Tax=Sulfuricurvum sp. IAE1 TaxID=2546102 RepID=UPI001047933D|nr:hypothetical protein [Sulfuricurvum sp. IAE1]TDA63605.1 hypothetical protein E0765_07155 [Sulfuricurvum sp. IAE1]
MRDIKFKGLTTKNKWVYGSLVITTHGIKHMPHTHTKTWIIESAFGNGGWFSIGMKQYVRPETVCEFTGQYDGDFGTEIYEGDIVLVGAKRGIVEIINGNTYVAFANNDLELLSDIKQMTSVIGNKNDKTNNARKVLQLMDNDYSYCDAVALVCKETGADRQQLEKELDPFI